jgi:transcriptional regulator with XRE-family HTH domain
VLCAHALESGLCALYTCVVRTITEQLNDALGRKGWSMQELLEKSGLSIDRSSLSRKIRGELRLNTDEAEALASALETTIVWPQKRRAKAA